MNPTPATADDALRVATRQGLRQPLSALRAALEGLATGLEPDPERAGLLARALLELERVDRCAEALTDYAVPPALHPLACTVREVARYAHEALPESLRSRVLLAQEPNRGCVFVDGPLLARRLARLIEEVVLDATGEVLLHAHQRDGAAYFSIVEAQPRDTEACQSRIESLVALRDLERMGAQVRARRATPCHRCVVVRLPAHEGCGGEA